MKEYHKINTIFKRDPETRNKTLLEGQYSVPEFEYLANNKWIFTEKIDGTNIRVMWDGKKVTFGGKTECGSVLDRDVNAAINTLIGAGAAHEVHRAAA